LRGTVAFLGGVLPDFTITHQDIVATGGKVAVRSVSRGTHTGGEMLGFAPTGRVLEYRAFDFHHVQGRRIVRSWHLEDLFAVLQQLQAGGNAS
jgi:predicted ester cyclase